MAKWIRFVQVGASPSGVTRIWEVRTVDGLHVLARIAWSTAWRKYELRPDFDTGWEQDCLRDVADFLEAQTREHKASRAATRIAAQEEGHRG